MLLAHVSRVMKLDTESPIVLERIRGDPPLKVEGAWQELQNCSLNRFRCFWVLWKGINLISRYFDFYGLFHVSIVDFQVDLCKTNGFACVIRELGGGLSDLG